MSPRPAHLHSLPLLSCSGTRQSGKLTSFDCICKASLSYRNYRILPMCGLPMCIYIPRLCVSASLSLDFFVSELELLLIALRLQHSVRVWVIIPNTHTTRCTAFFFLAAFPFYFSFRKTCNTFRLSFKLDLIKFFTIILFLSFAFIDLFMPRSFPLIFL